MNSKSNFDRTKNPSILCLRRKRKKVAKMFMFYEMIDRRFSLIAFFVTISIKGTF